MKDGVRGRELNGLHRVTGHPGVELAAGLLMAAAAVWTTAEFVHVGRSGVEIHHGFFILGAFVALRALALLLEGAGLVAEGAHGSRIGDRAAARVLCTVARHPAFELFTAGVLLVAGFVEAWEVRQGGTEAGGGLGWCFALVLVGASMLGKSLHGVVQSARFLDLAERASGRRFPLLDGIARLFRRPAVELTIGLLLVAVVAVEWSLSDREAAEAAAVFGMECAVLTYGLVQVLRHVPSLFSGIESVAEAAESHASRGTAQKPGRGGRHPTTRR